MLGCATMLFHFDEQARVGMPVVVLNGVCTEPKPMRLRTTPVFFSSSYRIMQ